SGFAAGLAFGIVATVLPGRFGGDAARPGRVALAPAAQAPAAGVDLTALRNPVIVAAAPTPIAPPSEAASLPDLAASSPVPAVPRAAPEAIAPVSLDAAPVTVAIGPGIDAIAPAVPTAPVTADPQPAVVALASVAVSPALPPALGGTVADQPPAAQPLPAAFTPAEEVTAAPDAAPLAPAFEGRLVVHAPDSVPEAEFGKVLSQLEEAGYPLSESSRVPFTIKDDNVRYFHAADAELAAAIAEDLGAKARDFTSFSPAPPAGTIEIWLSGRGSAPAASKPRSTGSRSAADQKLQALRSRILNQLRNGDHL
ncbi:MAG: hypothetical protein KDE00_13155, partial [Rhodobacteraceae bacterium]|nr:hypothetical protein [Paracoccaceae bacterium]